ncbi:response regulator [Chloroflexus sp.]|uniref:response regulator transcription factor n=1 Tax=Chloroflexus sp. TaxID=1904827 RepID=UPI00298EDCB0|nr:response regulator [Chloroflexus sp.]MCX7860517.1 response regulator [Chloroflexus sp.]MDW8404181.1 response regulator [Chloroflexus sp.]
MTTADILLIEDSPSQALQFRLMLERAGYSVQVAATGIEGWRAASVMKPRMILLDIDLPGLDGFQVLNRLKRDRATKHIPVVMLTHRDHVNSVQRALNLGADDYLFKDDAAAELLPVVEQALALAQQAHL